MIRSSFKKLRKKLRSKYGAILLKRNPALLGVKKSGNNVLERIGNIEIEYNFDSTIGRSLFYSGKFEEQEILFCLNKLNQSYNPVVIDVGANIGLHCLFWAKGLENIKIFAFEPAPKTISVLKRNIARNNLDSKVQAFEEAISNCLGMADFMECDDDAYSSLKNTQRKQVIKTYKVGVNTIDNFVSHHELDRVSLIKVDVEGFEKEVIEGAIATLKKFKPDLFIEIFGGTASNPDPLSTIRLIESLGYTSYVLKDGRPEKFVDHSDLLYNYYFVNTH